MVCSVSWMRAHLHDMYQTQLAHSSFGGTTSDDMSSHRMRVFATAGASEAVDVPDDDEAMEYMNDDAMNDL